MTEPAPTTARGQPPPDMMDAHAQRHELGGDDPLAGEFRSVFTHGPLIRDMDATYDVDFDLFIPDWITRVIRCQLRFKPIAIRSSVAVSSSAVATPSGGGSTAGSETAHTHGVTPQTTSTPVPSATGIENSLYTGNETAAGDPHQHGLGSHTHTMGAHQHAAGGQVTSTGGASHNHSTPDHTHPAHDHSLTLAIAEGGSAAGLRLWLDGVDLTSALGGPWSAATVEDVAPYLVDADGKLVTGVHTVKFESTAVGALELWLDWFVIAKNVVNKDPF